MTIDKRFHFIPAANLLVTVPPSNDRLVLRRLCLDEGIALGHADPRGDVRLRPVSPTRPAIDPSDPGQLDQGRNDV